MYYPKPRDHFQSKNLKNPNIGRLTGHIYQSLFMRAVYQVSNTCLFLFVVC